MNGQTMLLNCPNCKSKLIVDLPRTQIWNDPEVISVVIGPMKIVTCSACNQTAGLCLNGITQAVFGLVPVTVNQDQIVLPTAGFPT